MNVLDLFSGIGGFSIGLERAGMRTVAFCEREPAPRHWLAHHWPGVPIFDDVRALTAESLRGVGRIDIIAGGFPCQPFSVAGKQKGTEDERHLWPHFARLIREIRPDWVLAENVPGLRTIAADRVLQDLEESGYSAWPLVVGADDIGAPHRRKRVWIVGDARSEGRGLRRRQAAEESYERCKGLCWPARPGEPQHDWESPRLTIGGVGRNFDGFSAWMDGLGVTHNRNIYCAYATDSKANPVPSMQALSSNPDAQAVPESQPPGTVRDLHAADLLRHDVLCLRAPEGAVQNVERRTETPGGEGHSDAHRMRTVRWYEQAVEAPSESGRHEQQPGESHGPMLSMPREGALGDGLGSQEKRESSVPALLHACKVKGPLREALSAFAIEWRSSSEERKFTLWRTVGPSLSRRLTAHRREALKALGNAVCPAVVEVIGRAIMRMDQ